MKKNLRIYVAGHNGLLGSAIVRVLKKNNYNNIIFATHNQLNLFNRDDVFNFFKKKKPEIIFNAAGRSGNINRCISHPATLFLENSLIQNNIFEAARIYNCKNLVYFASSCIYPDLVKQPIKEEYLFTGQLEQATEGYAASKIAGVLACKAYNKQYFKGKCRYIPLVPNTLYGPKDHFNLEFSHVFSSLILRFNEAILKKNKIVKLWGSGKPRREFIYTEDVADAAIFMVNNFSKLENFHYNVGTGIDTSIKKLAMIISKKIKYQGGIKWDTTKPDGRQKKLLSSKKINTLGWKSKISLSEGLDATYKWYLKNMT